MKCDNIHSVGKVYIYERQMPRSACISMLADEGLRCLYIIQYSLILYVTRFIAHILHKGPFQL